MSSILEKYMSGIKELYIGDLDSDDEDVLISQLDKIWFSMSDDDKFIAENMVKDFVTKNNLTKV